MTCPGVSGSLICCSSSGPDRCSSACWARNQSAPSWVPCSGLTFVENWRSCSKSWSSWQRGQQPASVWPTDYRWERVSKGSDLGLHHFKVVLDSTSNLLPLASKTSSSTSQTLIYVLLFIRTFDLSTISFKHITLYTYLNSIKYFVLRTQIQYTYFEYVKQSMYIKFEYVKQSTYIKFEYIFRVILLFQFCKFFEVFFWVRHADEWQSTCSNSLWEKRTWWLQLHFTVRSTSLSHVWFQLTFWFRFLGSFEIFWESSLTN